jgi:hypothetical protein
VNERIQELAKQAEDHADSQGFFVTIDFASDYQDCLMEKFAELVVQECCDMMITNQSIDKDPNWNRALRETSKKIKKHFGVK